MIGYIYSSSLRLFARPGRVMTWLVVVMLLAALSRWLQSELTATTPGETYAQLSNLFSYRVLALAGAIFSAAVTSQEVEQKTIVYLLTRPVARWKMLTGRILAAATITFVIGALSLILVSIVIPGVGPMSSLVLRDVVAFAVGALAYVVLFVFVSLIINKSMIFCLLFAFAWELAVPSMPGSIYFLSITTYLNGIAGHGDGGVIPALFGGSNVLGASQQIAVWVGWTVMIGLISAVGGLSLWWFSRFEFVPREDTE